MKNFIETRIRAIEKLKDDSHVRAAVLGLYRIIMQHSCIVIAEWISETIRKNPENIKLCTSVDYDDFIMPADGTLVRLLASLLVAAENLGWHSVGRNYWDQIILDEHLKKFVGAQRVNIEMVLNKYNHSRNDGVEGHGLFGGMIEMLI